MPTPAMGSHFNFSHFSKCVVVCLYALNLYSPNDNGAEHLFMYLSFVYLLLKSFAHFLLGYFHIDEFCESFLYLDTCFCKDFS